MTSGLLKEDLGRGIRVIQALATIKTMIYKCSLAIFSSCNHVSKKVPWRWSCGDACRSDQLEVCSYISRHRRLESSPNIALFSFRDNNWPALVRRTLLTQTKECWWWGFEIMSNGSNLLKIRQTNLHERVSLGAPCVLWRKQQLEIYTFVRTK